MEDDSGEWRPWPHFDPAALVDEPSHTPVLLRKQQFCNGKGLSVSPAQVLGRGGKGGGGGGRRGDPAALAHGPLGLELVG
jgi:hypothetical protein